MSVESSANPDADAGNQYGDYEGIVAFGGVVHPIWTDGRLIRQWILPRTAHP